MRTCTSTDNSNTYSSLLLFCASKRNRNDWRSDIEHDMDVDASFAAIVFFFSLFFAHLQLRSHQRTLSVDWRNAPNRQFYAVNSPWNAMCLRFIFRCNFCVRRTKWWTCNPCTLQFVSLPVLFLWFEIDFNITNGTAAPSLVYLIHRNRIISFGVQFAVRIQHNVRLIFSLSFVSFVVIRHKSDCAKRDERKTAARPIDSKQKDDSRLRSLQMRHEPMKANGFSLPDLSLHVRKIVSARKLVVRFQRFADTDEMEKLKNVQCCSQPLLQKRRVRAQRSLKEIINHKMLGSVAVIIAMRVVWHTFLSNL